MRLTAVLLVCAVAAHAQVAPLERAIPRSTLPGLGPNLGPNLGANLGAAERRVVVNARAMPWAALGRVQDELGGRCTGVLIAPDRVLTAAHCLVNRTTGGLIQPGSVHFLQGFSRGRYSGHARVAAFNIGAGWDPARRAPFGADWAVLSLATPIRGPVVPLWQGELAAGAPLLLGGYQQDRPEVLLADTRCALLGGGRDTSGLPLLLHGCAATRGASGAPLLLVLPDGRHAVAGVVSAVEVGTARGVAVPASQVSLSR